MFLHTPRLYGVHYHSDILSHQSQVCPSDMNICQKPRSTHLQNSHQQALFSIWMAHLKGVLVFLYPGQFLNMCWLLIQEADISLTCESSIFSFFMVFSR